VDREETYEGSPDLVYTVTLRDADGNEVVAHNDVTVTTEQGVVTISAGSSSGSFRLPVQPDDIYVDSETVSNSIIGINESNAGTPGAFEDLRFSGTPVDTVVRDTVDAVYIRLTASERVSEDGGQIIYTATLVDADGQPLADAEGTLISAANDITITLANGEVIVLRKGETSADSAPVVVNRDDVYLEHDAISNHIANVEQAN